MHRHVLCIEYVLSHINSVPESAFFKYNVNSQKRLKEGTTFSLIWQGYCIKGLVLNMKCFFSNCTNLLFNTFSSAVFPSISFSVPIIHAFLPFLCGRLPWTPYAVLPLSYFTPSLAFITPARLPSPFILYHILSQILPIFLCQHCSDSFLHFRSSSTSPDFPYHWLLSYFSQQGSVALSCGRDDDSWLTGKGEGDILIKRQQ